MLFKRDYSTPGPGIDPDEPEKFGFARFCEIFTLECRTMLKLNLMTLFACLPVITIPPALCAMNAVVRKMILDEPVECSSDFRAAFAKYWKQSYLVFLLATILPLFTGAASLAYAHMAVENLLYFVPCILSLFTFVATMLASSYLYPLLSTGLPLGQCIKYAFILGIGKPLRAIPCFAINFGLMFLTVCFFPLSLPYLVLIGLSIPCLIGQFFVRLNLRKFLSGRIIRPEE